MVTPALNPEEGALEPQPATIRKKRSMGALVSHLVGGNLASMAIRLFAGVLQGRLVAPATLGLFSSIGLVLRYAPFFQMGILDGLYRELPYHIGRGAKSRAEELASAAQAWALLVGSVCAVILLGIGGWHLAHARHWIAAGWFTNAVLVLVFYYKTYYLQVTYRTAHDFSRLALVGVVESISSLLLLLLVAVFSFYGLCLRALLTAAVGLGMLFLWRPIRVAPRWNSSHLKHLLRIGLPIFCVGQLYSFWSVLNSTLVLKYTGVEGMGLYSMVLMAYTSIEFIPVAVRQVVYPRMAERFGKTHSVTDLVQIAWKPILFTAGGLLPIVTIAWLLVDPVVHFLIPSYAAAIPAMRWVLLLPIVNSFYPVASIFQVARRQDLYGTAVGTGIITYLVAQVWLTRDEVSLVDFPQAMIIGQVMFSALCIVLVAHLQRRERCSTAAKR